VVAIIFSHVIILGTWDLNDQDIVNYFVDDDTGKIFDHVDISNALNTLSNYDGNCGGIVFILL